MKTKVTRIGAVGLVATLFLSAWADSGHTTTIECGPREWDCSGNYCLIFEGRPIASDGPPEQGLTCRTMDVVRRWKGPPERRVSMISNRRYPTEFRSEQHYLIYAERTANMPAGQYTFALCSPMALEVGQAAEQLRRLGPPIWTAPNARSTAVPNKPCQLTRAARPFEERLSASARAAER